jgi:predicted membrane protein
MEFFLPSILVLLVAAAIVFFVIPRFGPLVLAVVSLILLGIGIYNHYSMFQNEYRLSTWQLGAVVYAPYILIGVVILMIILYLTYLLPSGSSASSNNTSANVNVKANTINLPPPETATNVITEGANNAIRAVANLANVKVNTTNQPNNPANLGIFGNINNNNNNFNNNNNNVNNRGNGNGRANRNPYSPPFL